METLLATILGNHRNRPSQSNHGNKSDVSPISSPIVSSSLSSVETATTTTEDSRDIELINSGEMVGQEFDDFIQSTEVLSDDLNYLLSIDDGTSTDHDDHKEHILTHRNPSFDPSWEILPERMPKDFREAKSGSQGQVLPFRLGNSTVAVKRVTDKSLADIRHLKDLDHENIIKFKGISQDPRRNLYYIVMEWCNYGTLAEKLHDAHPILSTSNLCDFAQQIASGMQYLHSKEIIHRDLKPTNILLTRNNERIELKISDFGTHKVISKSSNISTSQNGTYAYMAPEVMRGEEYSFPVDVWSYGVVLWEMFLGLRPYYNLDCSLVVWAIGNKSFKLPIPASFPGGLRSLILEGCWENEPTKRMTFQEIRSMMLKGATFELRKIAKERWPPTQKVWKQEAQDKIQKHFQPKNDLCEGEKFKQKAYVDAYEKALEQAQRVRSRNNLIHLQLQECSMLLLRDRRELEMREEMLSKRERAVIQAESKYDNELNQLKETLEWFVGTKPTNDQLIKEELARRGIKLRCWQGKEDIEDEETCESLNTTL